MIKLFQKLLKKKESFGTKGLKVENCFSCKKRPAQHDGLEKYNGYIIACNYQYCEHRPSGHIQTSKLEAEKQWRKNNNSKCWL